MSLQALSADPGLPELGIAGDPGLMREVFRKHLRPGAGKTYQIEDCLLSRVRYRPADRCVLQYTLRLVEPETGRERSVWVTGVLYAGDRTERLCQRLRATDPGRTIPEASLTFEPVSFIPDLRMLVQVFPYDRRLPGLPTLMVGPSPGLEALLLTSFGAGDWHVDAWNVEPVRYRAELGAVLRYAVRVRNAADGRQEERRFYAKVYRDEAGERTYQVLRAFAEKAEAGGPGFTVGRPIAYLCDRRVLFQEEVPGPSLQQILIEGRDVEAAMRRAAGALTALQLDEVPTARQHRLEDEVAALERAGKLLQWACPDLRSEVRVLIGAIAAGLEDVQPRPAHLDFKLDHIVLDGDRLGLLDLDYFAVADPRLDAANLLAHLSGLPFRFGLADRPRRTAAQAFAEEYFARVPRAWRRGFLLHYAGAILKMAVGFFRRQEPNWPVTIAALVEESEEALAGRAW